MREPRLNFQHGRRHCIMNQLLCQNKGVTQHNLTHVKFGQKLLTWRSSLNCKVVFFTLTTHQQAVMPGPRIPEDVRQQCRDLVKAGHTYTYIAKLLHISVPSAKMHALRTGSTADLPRSGRPKVTTPAMRKTFKRQAISGWSAKKITYILAAKKGVVISRRTVERVLKSGRKPLAWLPVTRGKVLRQANMDKRVLFCEAHIRDNWQHTVFVDSKYLYVQWDQAKGMKYWWQDESNPRVFAQQTNPMVFHFYAAVAYGNKTMLVFVPPTKGALGTDSKGKVNFNSSHFVSAMKLMSKQFSKWFPPGVEYRVVLDNARQHTSKEARLGLGMQNLPVMEDFPAQCWDINVIEVCWAWLSENLRGHNPKTWGGWMRAIKKAWAGVDEQLINTLVDKVPEKLQSIIEADGRWVEYYP